VDGEGPDRCAVLGHRPGLVRDRGRLTLVCEVCEERVPEPRLRRRWRLTFRWWVVCRGLWPPLASATVGSLLGWVVGHGARGVPWMYLVLLPMTIVAATVTWWGPPDP
jgi:hypothetical protein